METDTDGRMQIRSLEDFFRIIRIQCTDYNADERTRQKYDRLRQTRSVREYAIDLLDLADQLKQRPPDYEILHRFKSGLRDHVLDELYKIYDLPDNLFDFIELCDRIDNHWYSRQRMRRELHNRLSIGRDGVRLPPSYDNETRDSKPRNDKPSSAGISKDRSGSNGPRKGTPEWKRWCTEERRCFLCGNKGHSSRNCLKSGDSINNVNEVTLHVQESKYDDDDAVVYSDCESEAERTEKGTGRA
jgi:hypothetical protein